MDRPAIAVVAFDGISPFHLSVPCVVFGDATPAGPLFDLRVCTADAATISTNAGFSLHIDQGLAAIDSADTVIIPSWRDPAERPPERLLLALSRAQQRGAQIVGLCLGAYVLAEAGLLDARRATTHWAYAQDFALRYPKVRLDPDILYIEDGNILTSAGTAAGIDCCLHLVRRRLGSVIANNVARRLVVPPHRQGGQAQFIEQPVPPAPRGSRLGGVLDWARANLNLPHSVDSLAERASMSRRSFTRQFRQQMGMTVVAWLHAERLALAQRLLESSEHSVDAIAAIAGFGAPESLRLHFRRAFGVAPSVWRATFRS